MLRNSCRRSTLTTPPGSFVGIAAILLSLLLAGLAPAPAHAARYHVSTTGNDGASGLSWSAAWATIGRSLQVMMPGDSVLVANGRYNQRLETVRSGTAVLPITLVAAGDSVFLTWADDLDDSGFLKTAGFAHVWELNGWTQGNLRQTRFPSFVVDDPNWSRFTMKDSDGPIMLTSAGITSLARLDQVEGAYWVSGGKLYVHPHGNVTPTTSTTDFWSLRGNPALLIRHDHIVVDGFRIWYADGTSAGMNLLAVTDGCKVKNCWFAGSSFVVDGRDHLIQNLRATHANMRGEAGLWYEDCGGAGISLIGSRITVQGGEIWHNWNNISSRGDTLTVDGVRIHGAPNHAWLPTDGRMITMRNVIQYNCQDGLYISSCEDVLIENCTCFDGVFGQITPGGTSGLTIGPITVRNSILMGGFGFLSGTPASAESGLTFEKNILFKTGTRGLFKHVSDGQYYDLAGYLAHIVSHPSEPHATMTGNVQVTTGFASIITDGAWTPETDSWDVHIARATSIARNTGSAAARGTRDFEGDPRPAGAGYDIGADEFRESGPGGTGVKLAPAAGGTPSFPSDAGPNPFGRTTVIRFRLAEAAAVSAGIYDATGRLVRRLADSTMLEPGESGFTWDGSAEDGRAAAAGIYYYRIEAGSGAGSGRLVLMR